MRSSAIPRSARHSTRARSKKEAIQVGEAKEDAMSNAKVAKMNVDKVIANG